MAKNSKQTYSITVIDVKGKNIQKDISINELLLFHKSRKTWQNVHFAINMDENMIQTAF